MVAAKRKTTKDANPQPMLALGWDGVPAPVADDEAPDAPSLEVAETAAAPDEAEPDEQPLPVVTESEPPAELVEEADSEPFAEEQPAPLVPEPEAAPADEPPPASAAEDLRIRPEPSAEPVPLSPAPVPERRSPLTDSGQGSVGARLGEARRQAGLTVARVAEETCLPIRFIEDLENGKLADLLPLNFSRSYVRRLCEVYCLPEAGIVKDFVREYEAQQDSVEPYRSAFHVAPDRDEGASKVVYVPSQMIGEQREGRSLTVGSVVAGVMVLVAVALSVTTVTLALRRLHREQSPVETEQAASAQPEPAPGEQPAPALPPIDLRRLILPEELPLDELPIPK